MTARESFALDQTISPSQKLMTLPPVHSPTRPMATINVEDPVGTQFDLPNKDNEGKTNKATTVEAIKDHQKNAKNDSVCIKFQVQCNKDNCEETLACDKLMDHIEACSEQELQWGLDQIIAHQGPL